MASYVDMPLLPDDEQWEDEATAARHGSLATVRATAKAWSESIALVLGVFTTAAFVKGPEALSDLADAGPSVTLGPVSIPVVGSVVVLLVLIAALALAAAVWKAAIAAQGSPSWTKQMTGPVLAAASAAATQEAISDLRDSRRLTVAAAVVVFVGMSVAWMSQVVTPAKTEPQNAIVITSTGVACVPVKTGDDGTLAIAMPNVSPAPIGSARTITLVEECP
jgi:hypothetical protein